MSVDRGLAFVGECEIVKRMLRIGEIAHRHDEKTKPPNSKSVIDSAGVLKIVLVSDGVGPRAVQNSNFKALAALAFKESSGRLAEQVKTDKDLAEKVAANPNYLARAAPRRMSNMRSPDWRRSRRA